jgi:acyl transferase domain-containing protein/acyl carrier protein
VAHEGLSPVKQALQAIQDLQAKLAAVESARNEPIAIVGMACRYPGAANLAAFWRLLLRGDDAVTEVPPHRWDLDKVYDPDPARPGTMTSRWAGLIDRLDEFDAAFFGISPREAPHVDPRQRLTLEIAWEALEDAGIPPDTLAGTRAGVFMATLTNDYDHLLFEDLRRAESYSGAGTANSIVANRLSYFLDLHGPSVALDTACSGSLVAVHLACESLRSGESTLALAGGVNVNLMPKSNVFFSKAGALSPTGRCRTFDRAADGMVRSDGAGIIVLKRLSQAVADGDSIVAVIKGSAVNHDGRSNGLMAPNGEAQRAVLTEAYRRAGVSPADVQYIEAHGTGTRLGDPIEVSSLAAVLTPDRAADRRCLLGSVKTNIGHSEAAAAIAGVIKTALALRHRVVPPTVHFTDPNPLIPFDRLPFAVPQTVSSWPSPDRPLIAGISGFGFGGTNAHVVLEAAPADVVIASTATAAAATVNAVSPHGTGGTQDANESAPAPQSQGEVCPAPTALALPLSARTPRALAALVHAYRDRLAEPDADAADTCAAAAVGRTHHAHRAAFIGDSRDALRLALDRWLDASTDRTSQADDTVRTAGASRAPDAVGAAAGSATATAAPLRSAPSVPSEPLVFVFSGQGSQDAAGAAARSATATAAPLRSAPSVPSERLVFVFSGQGSHWPRMGMELYAREPVFAAAINACDRLFARCSSRSILEELAWDANVSRLDETEITQPAIFAVQMALFALWRSFGITPAAVIGHSLGEVAAACAAGALSIEDGVQVVHHRSRLMARAAGRGRTAVVGLSLADAREAIRGYEPALAVAGSNSPDASVIAGDPISVERLQRMLEARHVFCRLIPGVNVAFHSPQMEPLRHELVRALADLTLTPKATTIPIVSTVTATLAEGESLDADYWGRNLREPFLFAQAIDTMLAQGYDAFVEVSPHTVLSSSIAKCARHAGASGVPVLCSIRRGEPEAATLLGQVARLYELGQPVRWQNVYRRRTRSRTAAPLPTYPWQRQRYWFDQLSTGADAATPSVREHERTDAGTHQHQHPHPLLGAADAIEPATLAAHAGGTATGRVCLWDMTFDETHPPYVSDHRVQDSVVLPGAAIVEIAQAVARQLWPDRAVQVSDLLFEQALRLSDGPRRVQATLTTRAEADAGAAAAATATEAAGVAAAEFTLHSRPIKNGRPEGAWTRHATGRITMSADAASGADADADANAAAAAAADADADVAAEAEAEAEADANAKHVRSGHGMSRDGANADANASASASGETPADAPIDIASLKARCPEAIAPDAHYDAMEATGLRYGPSFRAIRALHVGPREAVAEITLSPALADARYAMHPALLDAAITTIAAVVRRDDPENYLPHGIRRWQIHRRASDRVWCHARYTGRDGHLLLADLDLFDDRGSLIAKLEGLTLTPFGAPRRLPLADSLIEECWEPSPISSSRDDDDRAPTAPPRTPATWLLLADETGLAEAVANHLRARGDAVTLARVAPEYRRRAANEVELPADRPEAMTRLLTESGPFDTIAHFWSLDTPTPDELRDSPKTPPLDGSANLRRLDLLAPDEMRPNAEDRPLGAAAQPRNLDADVVDEERPSVEIRPLDGSAQPRSFDANVLDQERPSVEARPLDGGAQRRSFDANVLDQERPSVEVRPLDGGACPRSFDADVVDQERPGVEVRPPDGGARPRSFDTNVLDEERPSVEIRPLDGGARPQSLDGSAFDETLSSLSAAATIGCVSALHLAQALVAVPSGASSAAARSTRLWFVTRGAQAIRVGGAALGGVAVAQAPLNGLALAVAQEHPELRCSTLDVDRAVASAPDTDALLVSEELLRGGDETRVAWRGGTRYVARLGRWRLSQDTGGALAGLSSGDEVAGPSTGETGATPRTAQRRPMRSDATYLITGGLGALGLQTALHFARQGARHIVLTGRRGGDGCDAAVLEAIRRIEQLGAAITVASADVANAADVERLFSTVLAGMPPLAGVVHAAGVLDDALLAGQSADRLQRVMAPKVLGAWHLHLRTRALPLDFFVCYSSAASLIGSAGQANYAAGNAFLDALAHHRRACGLPALSINWSAWGGDGMAATDQMRQRLEARGMSVMRGADALGMLSRLLQDPACPPAIGVIPADWTRFVQQFPSGVPARFVGLVPAQTSHSAATAAATADAENRADQVDRVALVALPAQERGARLRDIIRRELAVVLGFEASAADISPRAKYFDLGMDSLTAVEFRNRLQHTFAITLPATLAFDYPTIETLAESIDASLAAAVAASASAAVAARAARGATETTAPIAGPVAGLVAGPVAESAGVAGSESVPQSVSESVLGASTGVGSDPNISADLLDALPTHEIARLLASELDEEAPRVR